MEAVCSRILGEERSRLSVINRINQNISYNNKEQEEKEMLRRGDGRWVLKDAEKLDWGNRMEGEGRDHGPGSKPHCAKACR